MKEIFLITAIWMSLLFADTNKIAAQATKFGYFDLDYAVSLMPGISHVDTLLTIYERDSLGQQYQELVKEYMVYDSLLRVPNCGIGRKLDEVKNAALFQIAYRLQNWLQYSQQAMHTKHQELMQPFLDTVMNAYHAVVSEGEYAYIFKRDALWQAPPADNLVISVLKRLGMKVPDELLQHSKGQAMPLKLTMPVRRLR